MATTALMLDRPGAMPKKRDAIVLGLLLVLGIYLPTSFDGNSSKLLFGIDYVVCLALFSPLLYRSAGLPSLPVRIGLLSIGPLLLVFTYSSGLHNYSLGELAAFGLLSVLYIMNLRQVRFPSWLSQLYVIVSVLNIMVCIAILTGSEAVKGFLVAHYSSFYPELVPAMLTLRKPVLTFGTHSLAGFFFYLFFYANFQTYKLKGKKLFLALAISHLFLTAALLSVTGLLLALVGLVQVFYHFWSTLRRRWFWASAILAVVFLCASFQLFDPVARNWGDVSEGGKAILMSPDNGFLGRLRPGGTVYEGIRYFEEHPFSPLGASEKEGLVSSDNGLFDYLLRGSIILVIFTYGGLFYFLKRSLLSKADVYFLFGIVVIFELGFSTLTYFRMLFLLPFFVVYLNGLRRVEGRPSTSGMVIPHRDAVPQ